MLIFLLQRKEIYHFTKRTYIYIIYSRASYIITGLKKTCDETYDRFNIKHSNVIKSVLECL